MRDKVALILASQFDVIGFVPYGRELLRAEYEMKPDVCVVDIFMPDISGIDAVSFLKASGSRAGVILLTIDEDPDFLQAALEAGALGYVIKSRIATDLCAAVERALDGKLFISPSQRRAVPIVKSSQKEPSPFLP